MKKTRDIEVVIGSASVFKRGATRYDLRDPYHMAIAAPWVAFTIGIVLVFFALNLLFALGYVLQPSSIMNARPGSLYDAFFFSIETMATVGYGGMTPATTYGHMLSSLESVAGIGFTAVATGIIFVRFSRPRSRMMFADRAVITQHDGKPTLMVRVAYARASTLINAIAELDIMMITRFADGQSFRFLHALPLTRRRMPALILAWTLMHVIDEKSPLFGMDRKALEERDARLMLTIAARDQSLGTEVNDVRAWSHDQILLDRAYADVVTISAENVAYADLTKLSELKPEA